MSPSDNGYAVSDVIRLFRRAAMSTSYKPALLAAMVRRVTSEKVADEKITLESLGSEFLSIYWSQVVIYRLRHSPRDESPPLIIREIKRSAEAHNARLLTDVPPDARNALTKRIAKVL